jgi:outer membrane lipoprotein SlyB
MGWVMNARSGRFALTFVWLAVAALAGCATGPAGGGAGEGAGARSGRCQSCGVVQDVLRVDPAGVDSFGAVTGGAMAAGAPGSQAGNQQGGDAWHIVVRLDNGQYVSITQHGNSGVRNGDYVELRDGKIYAR